MMHMQMVLTAFVCQLVTAETDTNVVQIIQYICLHFQKLEAKADNISFPSALNLIVKSFSLYYREFYLKLIICKITYIGCNSSTFIYNQYNCVKHKKLYFSPWNCDAVVYCLHNCDLISLYLKCILYLHVKWL